MEEGGWWRSPSRPGGSWAVEVPGGTRARGRTNVGQRPHLIGAVSSFGRHVGGSTAVVCTVEGALVACMVVGTMLALGCVK
jgi:hypothetical protein